MRWLVASLLLVAVLPFGTWFVLYRVAGYGTGTVLAAQLGGMALV